LLDREKVAKDEREHGEKVKRERDVVLDKEHDERLALLRAKKQRKTSVHHRIKGPRRLQGLICCVAATSRIGAPGGGDGEITEGEETHASTQAMVVVEGQEQNSLATARHVNLFAEAEAAHAKRESQNEEYLQEKEDEELDMNKKLSIGLGTSNPQQGNQGDVNHKPWWAEQGSAVDLRTELALVESKRSEKEKAETKKAKTAKKEKKEKKREKKEAKRVAKREGKLMSSSGKSVDVLRQERLEREGKEKARAQNVGRVIAPPPPEPVSKYSSGYHKAESRTNVEYRSRLGQLQGRQGGRRDRDHG